MKKKGTIIFDLDDTLFDAAKLKEDIFSILSSAGITIDIVRDSYARLRETASIYRLSDHVELLYKETGVIVSQEIQNQILNIDRSCYVEDEVKDVLTYVREGYDLWLLSLGEQEIQWKKLTESGLDDFFDLKKIIITEEPKEIEMKKISLTSPTYFINDKVGETEVIAEQFPHVQCIVVGDGKHTHLARVSSVVDLKNIL